MGLGSNQEQHKIISIFSPKEDETKHIKTRFKWEDDIK